MSNYVGALGVLLKAKLTIERFWKYIAELCRQQPSHCRQCGLCHKLCNLAKYPMNVAKAQED